MVNLFKEEVSQIVCDTEKEAVVAVRLKNDKRPLRLGTKVNCMVISFFKNRRWSTANAFPLNFIPSSLNQLEMAIGVTPRNFLNSPDHSRLHLIRASQSKLGWVIPAPRPAAAQKKKKADAPPAPVAKKA